MKRFLNPAVGIVVCLILALLVGCSIYLELNSLNKQGRGFVSNWDNFEDTVLDLLILDELGPEERQRIVLRYKDLKYLRKKARGVILPDVLKGIQLEYEED